MSSAPVLTAHPSDNDRPPEPASLESTPSHHPAAMPNLINLPNEIVHNILTFVDPSDLGRVPRTCRALQRFVEGGGQQLWKDVYCGNLVGCVFSLPILLVDRGGREDMGIFG